MMTQIANRKILALVLAGGKGSRLNPLTTERAKPAVPFLGTYRLIDFTLSNLVNSGVNDVWVIEQYLPHDLNDHLSGGRPWDLDRTRGGLVVLPPFSSPQQEDGEFAQGNAHALEQHAHLIAQFAPDIVLVLSADHIYHLNHRELIEAHIEYGASVTMLTTQVEREEASRFGNVIADKNGKVKQFAYKPDEPLGRTVTTEVFAYDTKILLSTLKELGKQGDLGDYGEQLLPALVARGDAYALPLRGYWRDVGTIEAYHAAQMDFIDEQGFELDDPQWPFITNSVTRPPTRIEKGAVLERSLVCGGAIIAGEVRHSLIAPNAVIEKGAVVRHSIIQPGAVIRSGAEVVRAIVDQGATLEKGARVGGRGNIAVIGAHAKVTAGARVRAGYHVAPRQRVKKGQEDKTAHLPEEN